MPSLGYQAGTPTGAVGATGIISVTWTEEVAPVDITHRGYATGITGAGYKVSTGGWVTNTAEIECYDASAVIADLRSAGSGFTATKVSENSPLDGAVTFTVTVKQM
jgi:hypothetical protein